MLPPQPTDLSRFKPACLRHAGVVCSGGALLACGTCPRRPGGGEATDHALTADAMSLQDPSGMVEQLNRTLEGWANYVQVGSVSRAYRVLDSYTATRLRRRSRHTHKVRKSNNVEAMSGVWKPSHD